MDEIAERFAHRVIVVHHKDDRRLFQISFWTHMRFLFPGRRAEDAPISAQILAPIAGLCGERGNLVVTEETPSILSKFQPQL
jgi:hypothetical protein